MDDLLALLDDDPESGFPKESNKGSAGGLLEQERSESINISSHDSHHNANQHSSTSQRATSQPPASVDHKVGIRMVNRKLSGSDLLDLVMTFPYHSAPSIASMSTAALNRLLVDPASTFLDRESTVAGPTNLVTVAIVLSNSGTKISNNSGNAYCILTLGTLASGAAVSVMLFGSAYSDLCRTCVPGKVVALVCPRLAPAKTQQQSQSANFATTVLFSAQNTDQCRLVADARDFGRCKAKVGPQYKGGAHLGDSSSSSFPITKQCKNIIDTRQGEYCSHHRKLALRKSGTLSTTSGQAMSNLLAESKAFCTSYTRSSTIQTGTGRVLTLPQTHQGSMNGSGSSVQRRQGNLTTTIHNPTQHPKTNTSLTHSHQFGASRTTHSKNSLLRPTQKTSLPASIQSRTPLPVSAKRAVSHGTSTRPVEPKVENPYTSAKSTSLVVDLRKRDDAISAGKISDAGSTPLTTDWLHPKGRRVSLSTDKKKQNGDGSTRIGDVARINVDSSHRNGTVLVPKPSMSVFAQNPLAGQRAATALKGLQPQPKEKTADDILLRQQAVAEQLMQRSDNASVRTSISGSKVTPLQKTQLSTREALLFDGVATDMELETLVAAKSKYESEAMAEEYTRSRNRIVALDQQESKASNASRPKSGPIEKTWHCATCQRTFKATPLLCQRRGHVVKMRRSIQVEQKSKDDERLATSEAKDGLILGHGLEWSRWKR